MLHPCQNHPDVRRKPYQVVVAVFGAQHGGDLPQVGSVALLLHAAGEGDRDDSLCDVDQVQLVALLQGLQQTRTPVREVDMHLPFGVAVTIPAALSNFAYQRPQCAQTKLRWTAGPQKDSLEFNSQQ